MAVVSHSVANPTYNSKTKFDKLLPLNIYGEIRDFNIVPSLKSSDSLILVTGISNSKIITKYVK